MKKAAILLVVLALSQFSAALAVTIIPGALITSEANSDLAYPIVASDTVRSQQWIRYDQFQSVPGLIITGISFRADTGLGGAFTVTDNLTIKLGSTSADATTLSSTFDNNFTTGPAKVFEGTTTLNFAYSPSGPQLFTNRITFTTPFVYIPGANNHLLVDITNNGGSSLIPLEGQTNCLGATPTGCNLDAVMYDTLSSAVMSRIRTNPGQAVNVATVTTGAIKGLVMQLEFTGIPEPSSITLSAIGALVLVFGGRRSIQIKRS